MLPLDDLPEFLKPTKIRRMPMAGGRGPEFAPTRPSMPGTEFEDEAGGGVASKVLTGARMVGQLADNWCWSAVTQTIIDFVTGTAPPQDRIATQHIRLGGNIVCRPVGEKRMNGEDCGDAGTCRGHCNDFHRVRVVLDENGRFDATIASDEPPSFALLKSEVDSDRPVVCRVAWDLGGGHFIVVSGWTIGSDGVERVHVLDPKRNEGGEIIPETIVPYDDFATSYTLMGATGSINFAYRIQ